MKLPNPPRLVIFDCDGVLVDSEMIASGVLNRQLTALGFSITEADCRERFTGLSIASVRAIVEQDFGRALDPGFEDRLKELDQKAFERDLTAVKGIKETLEKIPVPVCVASSGTPEKIHNSLRLTGLTDFFDQNVFSAVLVSNGKPAPDLFELAARQMRISPNQAVVIEDSPSGIRAAGRAHMQLYGFSGASHAKADPGYEDKLRDAGAKRIFDDMALLPELLGF